MSITQFTMEEVRCFGERQTLEIRPLTFLVGENSTGKTTALACLHVLANYLRGEGVDFNSSLYPMGTFKDIVRNSEKKEKVFKLGVGYKHVDEDVEWIVDVEFFEKKGGIEPAVSSVTVKFADGEIIFKIGDKQEMSMYLVDFDEKWNQYRIECRSDVLDRIPNLPFLRRLKDPSIDILSGPSEGKGAFANYLEEHQNSMIRIFGAWSIWGNPSIFSTAPIRSQPKRTYDPTREFDSPEVSAVPMLLMQIEAAQGNNWEALKTRLVEFGKSSGLFQNVQIKKMGRSPGDPFQLKFKIRGPNANLLDVGYGVSQILPILVHILNSDISQHTERSYGDIPFFLVQQPEVHLHPKAQAELSSLLAQLANEGNRAFIVETHSDYMIDRARIEIIRGNIQPEDVSLIYFEPKGRIVKVHNISFDKMANMVGDPPHYGEFFLKESKRLLGFKD